MSQLDVVILAVIVGLIVLFGLAFWLSDKRR
jgi:LPXTG-motif cell wall-anchored protein